MKVAVGVKIGTKKQVCDDTVIFNEIIINDDSYVGETDELVIVGVADGVGGNAGGKEASSFVVKELLDSSFASDAESIRNVFQQINKALIEYASSTCDKKLMATTLTAMISVEGKYYLAHIGNTRMYVGQGSYLKQITQDHTTYQWLMTHGQEDAAESCNKNEISACMGGGNVSLIQQMDIRQIFDEGIPNSIILTSDGVHEHLEIDRFEELVFSGKNDTEIIKEVIAEVEKNGSEDDKTIVIIRK